MKFAAAIVPFLLTSVYGSEDPASSLRRKLQGAATWKPGDFSGGEVVEDTVRGTKIFLSKGLKGKAIAWDGEPVTAHDGTLLAQKYHVNCDGGAVFSKSDGSGGYYYVSNSEIGDYPDFFDEKQSDRRIYAGSLSGGVYSLEFNSAHQLVGYKQVLANTGKNCHGGITAWNSWVSCEEHRQWGRCWQVDPSGMIPPQPTVVTGGTYGTAEFGNWEAFAWDGTSSPPRGYTTNDDAPAEGLPAYRGAIVRFTPDATALACLAQANDADKWCALNSGKHDYLKLTPASAGAFQGTFEWVSDITQSNPELYAGSEGAHVEGGILTFSTVKDRELYRLNLNSMTYVKNPVPFPFEPDNLRILGDRLYLCTDGDHQPGDAVWGWDNQGAYRIFYEENHNYPAGVDFTPDGKMMYVSLYGEATWQFWREDGLAFDDPTAGIVYEVAGGIDECTQC